MTLLPIVDRELRVAARRPATHRSRLLTVLAASACWALLLLAGSHMAPARLGQHLFLALYVGGFGLCLLAGVLFTADSLSAEKRDGTMGLLFLTDLRGYDVVLGKLAVTSLHGVYLMIGLLPLLGLPLLLGGVTGGEFLRVVLVLFVTLMLSLTAGMAVSAATRETRHALGRTLFLLIGLAGLVPAVWWLLPAFVGSTRLSSILLWPCPGYGLFMAWDTVYRTAPGRDNFWGTMITCATFSLVALIFAAWALPRTWRDEGDQRAPGPAPNPSAARGMSSFRVRAPWLDLNPCRWLAERGSDPSRLGRLGVGVILVVWAVGLVFFTGVFNRTPMFMFSFAGAFLLHQLFKTGLVLDATRRLSEDRHSGALELLLVTALAPEAIAKAHAQTARARFRPFRGALIIVNLVTMIVFSASPVINPAAIDIVMAAGMFLGGILVLFTDSHALLWVGIEAALTAPRHSVAVWRALRKVMGPSWAGMFIFIFAGTGGALDSEETVAALIWLWVIGSAIAATWQGNRARQAVLQNFRGMATAESARHPPRRPWAWWRPAPGRARGVEL